MESAVTTTAPATPATVDWPTDAIGSTARPRAGAGPGRTTAAQGDDDAAAAPGNGVAPARTRGATRRSSRPAANGTGRRSRRADLDGASTTPSRANAPATEGPAGARRERFAPSSDHRETQATGTAAPTVAARIPQFRLPALIAIAIVAILIAAAAYLGLQLRQDSSLNSLRSGAVSAAKTYGGYLSSYDYKDLTGKSSAWAKVEANATASFRKDFSATSGSLGKLLTQYNATAEGKVIAAGVSSLTGSRAVVLLFIDQTVTNTVQKPNSVTQPLRVELTMIRQHGRWLIDNLQVPK